MDELFIITTKTPAGPFHMIAEKRNSIDVVITSGFGDLDSSSDHLPAPVSDDYSNRFGCGLLAFDRLVPGARIRRRAVDCRHFAGLPPELALEIARPVSIGWNHGQ